MRYAGSKLIIAGSAPYVWLANLRAIISQVRYIDGLDNSDFVVAERKELGTLIDTNQDFQLFFSSGINVTDESRSALRDLTRALARIVDLDRLLEGIVVKFSITGHTDGAGTDEQNMAMRDKRARALANLLTDSGVDVAKIVLFDNALGSGDANAVQTRSAKLRLDLIAD